MEFIRERVGAIVFLVVAISFFEGFFPSGSMNKYLKYIFGLVLLSAVLTPIMRIFD